MNWVVDTSVVCKWYFEERLTGNARALLASGDRLVAPIVLLLEVSNLIWKKKRGSPGAEIIGVDILRDTRRRVEIQDDVGQHYEAYSLALRLNHPVYDCHYLTLSALLNAPLITDDLRLIAAAARGGWTGSLIKLADFEGGSSNLH